MLQCFYTFDWLQGWCSQKSLKVIKCSLLLFSTTIYAAGWEKMEANEAIQTKVHMYYLKGLHIFKTTKSIFSCLREDDVFIVECAEGASCVSLKSSHVNCRCSIASTGNMTFPRLHTVLVLIRNLHNRPLIPKWQTINFQYVIKMGWEECWIFYLTN